MRQKRYQKAKKAKAGRRPLSEEASSRDEAAVKVEERVEEQQTERATLVEEPGIDTMQAPPDIQPVDEARRRYEAWAGEKAGKREGMDGAVGLQNLAAFYHVQGCYQQAEKLYRQALAIFESEKEPGIAPTAIATTLRNLALVSENQSRYQEAEEFYRRAQSVMELAPADERSTAISIMRDYADLLYTLGRDREGQELEERITMMLRQDILSRGQITPRLAERSLSV
jgi:tetratricopeptide (TPR) repeat protein